MAGLPQDIPRTRKQVVKQLLNQELVDSAKQLAKRTTKKMVHTQAKIETWNLSIRTPL